MLLLWVNSIKKKLLILKKEEDGRGAAYMKCK